MIMSNRPDDNVSERALDDFLTRCFYKKEFNKIEPITDETRQLLGIDVIADSLIIDNKGMLDKKYLNNPSSSFCLEICSYSLKSLQYYLGWFLDKEKLTDHYLFVWLPDVDVPSGQYLTNSKQINKIEVMLVNREEVHKMVNKYISDEDLKTKAKYMISNNINRLGIPSTSMRLVKSSNKAEAPVVLVVPKFMYKKIAIKHCYVTADGIEYIK